MHRSKVNTFQGNKSAVRQAVAAVAQCDFELATPKPGRRNADNSAKTFALIFGLDDAATVCNRELRQNIPTSPNCSRVISLQ
jgi:hypothetical protein